MIVEVGCGNYITPFLEFLLGPHLMMAIVTARTAITRCCSHMMSHRMTTSIRMGNCGLNCHYKPGVGEGSNSNMLVVWGLYYMQKCLCYYEKHSPDLCDINNQCLILASYYLHILTYNISNKYKYVCDY